MMGHISLAVFKIFLSLTSSIFPETVGNIFVFVPKEFIEFLIYVLELLLFFNLVGFLCYCFCSFTLVNLGSFFKPHILYLAKLSFNSESKIYTFCDKLRIGY